MRATPLPPSTPHTPMVCSLHPTTSSPITHPCPYRTTSPPLMKRIQNALVSSKRARQAAAAASQSASAQAAHEQSVPPEDTLEGAMVAMARDGHSVGHVTADLARHLHVQAAAPPPPQPGGSQELQQSQHAPGGSQEVLPSPPPPPPPTNTTNRRP